MEVEPQRFFQLGGTVVQHLRRLEWRSPERKEQHIIAILHRYEDDGPVESFAQALDVKRIADLLAREIHHQHAVRGQRLARFVIEVGRGQRRCDASLS